MATTPACAGAVLNLGAEAPEVPIGEVAALIARVVGKTLTIAPQPATPGSPERRCPDMSRMAELTGYRARVSLEDGVRRTWDWYRDTVFAGREESAR